jgi:hypothetical protein
MTGRTALPFDAPRHRRPDGSQSRSIGYDGCMENQTSKPQPPCPQCGGTQFSDGTLMAAPFVAFFQKRRLLPRVVTGTRCESCGHLVLFADRPRS